MMNILQYYIKIHRGLTIKEDQEFIDVTTSLRKYILYYFIVLLVVRFDINGSLFWVCEQQVHAIWNVLLGCIICTPVFYNKFVAPDT